MSLDSVKKHIDIISYGLEDFWRTIVIRPVLRFQAWRCQRARNYLLRHDTDYREQYIVRRREKLYESGVSPSDLSIPDRWTMKDELPPMAWPHTNSSL